MRGIKGKVTIVTGGAGGIGAAVCRRFAEEGAIVAVFDINKDAAETVVADIRAKGGSAAAFAVDLTSQESVAGAVASAESQLGPTDILVNNAGWDHAAPFLKTDKALWDKIVAVNLYGPLYMHQAVLKGMYERGRGKVVNVASDAARVGSSGEAVYAFCKGGLVSYSKTMARELARKQINVNVVCPGPTDTALFADYAQGAGNPEKLMEAFTRSIPLGRIGQPGDLPGAILFFASDDSAYITGQVISVSGGLTIAG